MSKLGKVIRKKCQSTFTILLIKYECKLDKEHKGNHKSDKNGAWWARVD